MRDAAPTVGAALDSLARQTLVDHETIVVDDGSADETPAILAARARQDPRIRIISTPRRGLVPALTAALAAARAPLVARMDADDLAFARRLEVQAARFEVERELTVLGSRVELPSAAGAGMREYVLWSNRLLDHDSIALDLYVESPLVHPSVMIRAEALKAVGGWRDFDGPEDYDLWLRGHAAGWRFAKTAEPLLLWRDLPGRLTRTSSRYSAARFREVKLQALERGLLRVKRPIVVWGAGPIGKAWGRLLQQRGHELRAFVEVHPRRIGRRLLGAPVVSVETAAALPEALHLGAVGQRGARPRLRREALRLGLRLGETFVSVA